MRTLLVAGLILPPAIYVLSSVRNWDWWIIESQIVLMLLVATFAVTFLRARSVGQESRSGQSRTLQLQESAIS